MRSQLVSLFVALIVTTGCAIQSARGAYTVYIATDGAELPASADNIYAYSSAGALLDTFDDPFPASHLRWQSAQLGPDGLLYVTSFNFDNVYRWDPSDGSFVDAFLQTNRNNPVSSAFGPDGNLYVTSESPGAVARYNGTTGVFLGVFGDTSGHTRGVTFGPDGHLYVSVPGSVQRYDGTTGTSMGTFASGLSTFPSQVTFHGGDLYVSDFNGTIKRFDSSGNLIGTFATAPNPTSFAFTPDGLLLVTSYDGAGGNFVRRHNGTTGAFIDNFATFPADQLPTGLAILIPEPSGIVLFGSAICLFFIRRRRPC